MQRTLEGGCLCGAVRYRVTGPELSSGICHCRTCRRISSSPELPFAGFPLAAFSIVKGAPASIRSSASVTRRFCDRCGSPLTYQRDDQPDALDIMTCSLDDPDALPPTFHVWTSHRPSWSRSVDDLPAFETTRT